MASERRSESLGVNIAVCLIHYLEIETEFRAQVYYCNFEICFMSEQQQNFFEKRSSKVCFHFVVISGHVKLPGANHTATR